MSTRTSRNAIAGWFPTDGRCSRTVLTIAVAMAAGCAAPAPTVPAPLLLPTPVTALTITGLPASFHYGQTAQLSVVATLEDGAQKRARRSRTKVSFE
jgi:hypothetical protein